MTFDEWAKKRWDESPDLDFKWEDMKAAWTAAESRGREAGLREAAGIASTLFAKKSYKSVGAKLSDAILSRIPSPNHVVDGNKMVSSPSAMEIEGCEHLLRQWDDKMKFCPYCGEPIITAP